MTNHRVIETIRENLSPAEVMAIRQQERKAGRLVNVHRLHSHLVEIQIIHPNPVIDVTPKGRGGRLLSAGSS